MGKLNELRKSEPVRSIVYPALVLLAGLLVTKGVITDDEVSTLIVEILGLILIGGTAAEGARSHVFPEEKIKEAVADLPHSIGVSLAEQLKLRLP